MSAQSLLYQKQFQICKYVNDQMTNIINVMIPTVGAVIEDEDNYWNLVSILTAMPVDCMCQLEDIGIDFTTINEYDLFVLFFPILQELDTKLIFGDLDLKRFKKSIDEEDGSVAFIDTEQDIRFDRDVHRKVAWVLRNLHHLEKNKRRPANEEAKQYMLKRAREKMRRRKRQHIESQLEPLIVAMVNAEQYKYDFEGTKELSIYQFNESVRQVIKKVDYDNRMYGVYTGTLNVKDLSHEDLNWLTHK